MMSSNTTYPSTTPGFYDSRGELGISVCIAFSAISLVTLLARIWTRFRIVCNTGIDDLIIVMSWISATTFSALVVVQVTRGLGRHTWALTADQNVQVLAPFWASICFYQLTLILTKISILLQYLRIFVSTKVRRACWIVFSIVMVYGFWGVVSAIFMCTPVPYFWDKTIEGGHCLPEQPVWFGNAAMNIATDVTILLLPMPALSHLKLPKKQKIGLMMILALGGVVCIISMVRFGSLYTISVSDDVSWDNIPIADWTAVECNIGIMCACLPTLKPLLNRFLPFLIHSGPHHSSGTVKEILKEQHYGRVNTVKPTDKHTILTEASGPEFPMSRLVPFPPAKAVVAGKKHEVDDLDDVEKGRIKVITVVDQEVGDESENSSQRKLVW